MFLLPFHEQQNCQKTSGKAMPMFLSALPFFPKLNSDHESILQIFNPGILALKIGQT